MSLPFPVTSRVVSVGTAEFFFSGPSEILPGFKYTLAPESYSQKRGVSLEIGRKLLHQEPERADVAKCVDTGAMRIPDKLSEEEEGEWRHDSKVW